ncbi:MAG: PfkB family carbohydrate kinase [Anaerolineae bacterium]
MSVHTDDKIRTVDELAAISAALKQQGKVIVHCHGVFDLLHPGHFRHFAAARRLGDVLIVTLTRDEFVNKGPGRPVFNQRLRAESIAALASVDYVAINEWPTAVNTIHRLRPDLYVKGSEYAQREQDLTGKIYDEERAVETVGGRLAFTDDITFSSTQLLNNYFDVFSAEADAFLRDFRQRYSAGQVIEMLKALQPLRVLVIGDAIIDEYHYCKAVGKASKSATLTSRFLYEETYAGGSLAVANHVAGFCHDVHLVTVLGAPNSYEEFIRGHLKPNVTAHFIVRDDAPTIVKRRFVDPFLISKMFEVCYLNESYLPAAQQSDLRGHLQAVIADYDVVLVTDFGHGMLDRETIALVTASARFLAVNTQANSLNLGYNVISNYPRADYVCIDQEELRLAARDRLTPVRDLIPRLARQVGAATVNVTLGTHGSVSYRHEEGMADVPVFTNEVVDSIGAGDAYLAVTAPCVAAGLPAEVIGFIGNCVGALAVQIVGNKESVEPTALFKFITTLLK